MNPTDIIKNYVGNLINNDIKQSSGIPVFYLEGGHFDPRYPVTDFAINSLHYALRIASQTISEHKKRVRLALGILVDDLGLQCGVEACEMSPLVTDTKVENEIPPELELILAQYPIVKRDRLVIQGERTCKNRGIQTLRKVMAQHASSPRPELKTEEIDSIQKIIYRNEKSQPILLAESKSKGVWAAKCPMIMAQHYIDVVKTVEKLHPQTNAVHIIDFSETDDYNKVINGAEFAIKLLLQSETVAGKKIAISNIFLSPFDNNEFVANTVSNEINHLIA